MGETAEYQRLQETSEPDYQRLPSDDEEVHIYSSLYFNRRLCQTAADKHGWHTHNEQQQVGRKVSAGIIDPVEGKLKGVRRWKALLWWLPKEVYFSMKRKLILGSYQVINRSRFSVQYYISFFVENI